MKFTTVCMILPYVAFFFFYKVKYLYCCSLQQHMRSSSDLSSRPGIFALLRSQTLISTSSCFLRRQEEEVGADPSAVTWRRSGQPGKAARCLIASLGLELLFA